MVERCKDCGLYTGDVYGRDYYKLAGEVFCSLECFYTDDKKPKVERKNIEGAKKKKSKVRRKK